MPYIKPKKYKIECFECRGKGYIYRIEPPPNMRCPDCGTEGQMVLEPDSLGETRQCANCNYITDTYEVMKQYEKFHKYENQIKEEK